MHRLHVPEYHEDFVLTFHSRKRTFFIKTSQLNFFSSEMSHARWLLMLMSVGCDIHVFCTHIFQVSYFKEDLYTNISCQVYEKPAIEFNVCPGHFFVSRQSITSIYYFYRQSTTSPFMFTSLVVLVKQMRYLWLLYWSCHLPKKILNSRFQKHKYQLVGDQVPHEV